MGRFTTLGEAGAGQVSSRSANFLL